MNTRFLLSGGAAQNVFAITIQKAIQELVQLNQDHPSSYSRENLIRMLDEPLSGGR